MRLAPVLGLTVGLSAAACGGTTIQSAEQQNGGTAGSSGAAGNGAAGGGGTGASAGSGGTGGTGGGIDITLRPYELRFESVTSPAAPFPVESPSVKTSIRLDLFWAEHGVLAVATPRWKDPSTLVGIPGRDQLVLSGELRLEENGVLETWTSLTIPLGADGQLGATLAGSGARGITRGDVAWDGPAQAAGSVTLDSTPPELDTEQRSARGPRSTLLPWDPIVIRAAEGIEASALAAKLDIRFEPGPVPPITWRHEPAEGEPSAYPGIVRALGSLGGWFDADAEATIVVGAGISDRAGLLSGDTRSRTRVMGFPAAQARQDFDAAGPEVAIWGTALRLEQSATFCESAGCVLLGPFQNGYCPGPVGLAGRVITSAPSIAIHYQVLVGGAFGDATNAPTLPFHFSVQTALPGRAAATESIRVEPDSFEPTPRPNDQLRWVTPWTTLTIATPAAGDTGYAVTLDPCADHGLVALPPVPLAIVVDSISG
jgi:hypothetical protein